MFPSILCRCTSCSWRSGNFFPHILGLFTMEIQAWQVRCKVPVKIQVKEKHTNNNKVKYCCQKLSLSSSNYCIILTNRICSFHRINNTYIISCHLGRIRLWIHVVESKFFLLSRGLKKALQNIKYISFLFSCYYFFLTSIPLFQCGFFFMNQHKILFSTRRVIIQSDYFFILFSCFLFYILFQCGFLLMTRVYLFPTSCMSPNEIWQMMFQAWQKNWS